MTAVAAAVLVVGDVIDDVVVVPHGPVAVGADTDAEIRRCPGGSGANTAAWLGALGASSRFVGRAGAADVQRHVTELAVVGVDARIAADPDVPTGTIVVIVDASGERSFLTDRAANLRLSRDDLPASLLDGVGVLHVSGYSLFHAEVREAVESLMAVAKGRGVTVSVDPSSASFLAVAGAADFLEWTSGAGIIFPNLAEGRLLSGRESPQHVVEALLRHYEVVALKLGARGALVGARDHDTVQVDTPVVTVADTTGAGDAFAAGFLTGLSSGGSIGECARIAVAAGAQAVGVIGGRPVPPGY